MHAGANAFAVYDSLVLRAPICSSSTGLTVCSSGNLLTSTGTYGIVSEQNQPNLLFQTTGPADSNNAGSFHISPSVDTIVVTHGTFGNPIVAGQQIQASVTVWCSPALETVSVRVAGPIDSAAGALGLVFSNVSAPFIGLVQGRVMIVSGTRVGRPLRSCMPACMGGLALPCAYQTAARAALCGV